MCSNFLLAESKSSNDLQQHDTRRSIYRKEGECGSYSNIWMFVYMNIPKDKRKNLDLSSLKGNFVGYSASSKAYKIYIKEDRRIEVRMSSLMKVWLT